MAYSTVLDKPLKVKRRSDFPTIDGESIIQELGYMETKIYRFYWITTAELQTELEALEAEADGWMDHCRRSDPESDSRATRSL